jgi:hypothetical protein
LATPPTRSRTPSRRTTTTSSSPRQNELSDAAQFWAASLFSGMLNSVSIRVTTRCSSPAAATRRASPVRRLALRNGPLGIVIWWMADTRVRALEGGADGGGGIRTHSGVATEFTVRPGSPAPALPRGEASILEAGRGRIGRPGSTSNSEYFGPPRVRPDRDSTASAGMKPASSTYEPRVRHASVACPFTTQPAVGSPRRPASTRRAGPATPPRRSSGSAPSSSLAPKAPLSTSPPAPASSPAS